MSSLQLTREVENNLKLNLQSDRSTIKDHQWLFATQFLYQITQDLNLDDRSLANALYLVSDYFHTQVFPSFAMRMYATACLDLSASLVEEESLSIYDFIVANNEHTLDMILDARKKIIQHRTGKIRMLTATDILLSQKIQEKLASTISILCCIRHPTFTTIPADLFARACIDVVEGNNQSDILVQDILSYIVTFQDWASRVEFELSEEDSVVFELFTQTEGEANNLTVVSSSKPIERKKLKYEIVRSLGTGSTAEVFFAVSGEKVIAVKSQYIEPEYSSFVTELTVLSTYKHENVVELFGFSLKHDRVTFEMEAGVSLYSLIFGEKEPSIVETNRNWINVFRKNTRIESRLLPDREELGDDIVQGVRYLHSVGVLHNDIKLENIIVVSEGDTRRAKLIDFGVAELMVLPPGIRSHRDYVQTITYRAPELLVETCDEKSKYTRRKEGHSYGPDIWAVGVTLLCLETGVLCFPHMSMRAKRLDISCSVLDNITQILGSPPPDLYKNYPFPDETGSGIGSVMPHRTRERILAMLDYDPEKRILV